MTGVVCLSNILQESPEALGKSKSPVLQMCSRIYIFPELKDYVIAEFAKPLFTLVPSGLYPNWHGWDSGSLAELS